MSSEDDFSPRRRSLLGLAAAGLGGWICGWGGAASAHAPAASTVPGPFDAGLDDPEFWLRPRTLELVRVHTGERLTVRYWADGELQEDGYEAVCRLMRDIRFNQRARMDPALLDKLWAAQALAARHRVHRPLEILSAYRTPKTNRKIGGARGSLHTQGRAVDFRIPGMRPLTLARMLRGFSSGGVGTYRRAGSVGWVHADTGDPRNWRG
jgi:uncharacterized protein YcbK (DUF882 family)